MDYKASYLNLTRKEFEERIEAANKHLTECTLCPRECKVNRAKEKGYCQAGAELKVSSFGPHFGEERELVGRKKSKNFMLLFLLLWCENFLHELRYFSCNITAETLECLTE